MNIRPTNGVSYGVKYTVIAADVTNAYVDFDFRRSTTATYRYNLVANVMVLNSSNVLTNPANLAVTYPSAGTIRVAGTLVLGSIINLVAQRSSL